MAINLSPFRMAVNFNVAAEWWKLRYKYVRHRDADRIWAIISSFWSGAYYESGPYVVFNDDEVGSTGLSRTDIVAGALQGWLAARIAAYGELPEPTELQFDFVNIKTRHFFHSDYRAPVAWASGTYTAGGETGTYTSYRSGAYAWLLIEEEREMLIRGKDLPDDFNNDFESLIPNNHKEPIELSGFDRTIYNGYEFLGYEKLDETPEHLR